MKRKLLVFVIIAINFSEYNCQENCGTESLKLVAVNANATVRGEHPWKVALINDEGQFICGGSLVSNKAVVTAAQCIKGKGDLLGLKPEDLSVVLGAQDLSKSFEKGRVTVGVKSINVHPDYNVESDSYDGDIALLVLDTEVQFSATIQTVCLSKPQSSSAQVAEGIVVGYRKIEGTNNAGKLEVPIKNYHDCVKENDNLRPYLSARSLCASPNDEIKEFEAASGSGLYVFYNNRFYLRGTSSASSLNKKIDSVSAYGIFADNVEYCGWIQSGGTNKYAQCIENEFSTTTQPPTQPTTTQPTTTRSTTTSRRTTTRIMTTTIKPIRSTLYGGECLVAGEFLQSRNKCFEVHYQGDGNFVNYRRHIFPALWESITHGTCPRHACMQTDGNFVVYDCNGSARWNSRTDGHHGARIVIQDDGNLVVYAPNNVPLWNSGTVTHC